MSGIALTTPVARSNDSNIDVQLVEIRYDSNTLLVRLAFAQSGQTKDYRFSGASLQSLVGAVQNFAGLRTSLLQYLQTLDATLAGTVS